MAYTFLGNELNPLARNNRAVINIIIWCTMVFVVSAILSIGAVGRWILGNFMLHTDLWYFIFRPFSLVTYIFLHAGFWHLFSNMLWLFFIGIILEDLTGKKHIWRLFLGGGISGGILFLLVYNLVPFFSAQGGTSMVGASAGVTAVIIGTATFVPNYRIYLFGIIGVELVWIAFFRVLFDLLGMVGPLNQGGYIAHLGGALFGLLYMLHIKGTIHLPLVDSVAGLFSGWGKKKKSRPVRSARVSINADFKKSKHVPNQDEIDRILDKINRSGYESLTKEEKEALFRAGDN